MPDFSQLLQSTTNRLIAINVAVFIFVQALFAGQHSGFELFSWNNPQFHYWQIFTYMFLHGGWVHLGFNMLAFWSFGRVLERVWGGQQLLVFYLVCGVGAAVLHLAVATYQFDSIYQQLFAAGFSEADIRSVFIQGTDISIGSTAINQTVLRELYSLYHSTAVGASGAVYGILVAFALLFPNFKVVLIFLPIPIAAKYFVPVLLLVDLTAGITGISIFGQNNIAHFAHIGGAIAGFLLVQFWLQKNH